MKNKHSRERKMPVQSLGLKPDRALLTNSKEARADVEECTRGNGRKRLGEGSLAGNSSCGGLQST